MITVKACVCDHREGVWLRSLGRRVSVITGKACGCDHWEGM